VVPRERLLADYWSHGGRGSDQTRMPLNKTANSCSKEHP
jgi:hypothetical protein